MATTTTTTKMIGIARMQDALDRQGGDDEVTAASHTPYDDDMFVAPDVNYCLLAAVGVGVGRRRSSVMVHGHENER